MSCASPAQKLVEEYLARDARGDFLQFLVTYFILGTQSADGFKSDVKTLKTVFKVNATQAGLKIEQGAYQMVKQK